MEPVITTFIEETPEFWQKMGRYFAHRSYAQEMGGWQFYTKPGSVWFVLTVANEVRGFCAAIREKSYWYFDNFYVLPEYRNRGYATLLHRARWHYIQPTGEEVRVISNNAFQIRQYQHQGFVFTGMRGRYSKFTHYAKQPV